MTRTFQSRFLLRPSEALNQTIAGVIAKALERHPVKLHAVVFLSTHAHILLSPKSVEEMAGFMRFVNHNLSIEVGKLHDWPGSMWSRRYTSIPVSDEPEAQIARLKYVLENSCKEGLVLSPHDWPGIQSATALVEGKAIRGIWTNRTAFHNARKRNPDASLADFEEQTEFHLDPLPCWSHVDENAWRSQIGDLVAQIEADTVAMHRRNRTVPKGATARLAFTEPGATPAISQVCFGFQSDGRGAPGNSVVARLGGCGHPFLNARSLICSDSPRYR